jgi:hypothetical protein
LLRWSEAGWWKGQQQSQQIVRLVLSSVLVCGVGYAYISFVDVALWWQLENACILQLYIMLGYLYGTWKQQIEKPVKLPLLCCLLAVYLVIISFNQDIADIHTHQYGFFPLFLLSSFLGVSMLVMFSKWLAAKSGCGVRALRFVGRNTIVYYIFQDFFIRYLWKLYDLFGSGIWGITHYVRSIFSMLIVAVLLAIPTVLLNRYCPALIGKGGSGERGI